MTPTSTVQKEIQAMTGIVRSIEEVETQLKAAVKAGHPPEGTPQYFDWAAPHYGFIPDQVLRGGWLKKLVKDNLEWIGLDQHTESLKALDYCAGTGMMGQAFAPYVDKIRAIDNSRGMVEQYNRFATARKAQHPRCDMKAVRGDLIDRYNKGEEVDAEITDPDGEYQSFDMILMCLAIDYFNSNENASATIKAEELHLALDTLMNRLKPNGILVIVDIEKRYGVRNRLPGSRRGDGKKKTGCGTREAVAALNAIGMHDVEVKTDLAFKAEFEFFEKQQLREETYFMLRATKNKE